MRALTSLVPRAVRRRVAGPVGRMHGRRIRARLAAIAAGGRPILAGPWLGEVGFEILYWAPFLRWFGSEYRVSPDRLTVLSRGGTSSWYAPAAAHYRDVFDYVAADDFRQWQDERCREIGEQKQTRMTGRERAMIDTVLGDSSATTDIVHPSVMYELLNPFWWRHLDERWVHRHTMYRRLEPPAVDGLGLPDRYVAAKFYFNDCFPATEQNVAFARETIARVSQDAPVVSLSSGVALDDHTPVMTADGREAVMASAPSRNLHVQTAIVANASAFVGTYGGFAYLAPFFGVRSTSYYGDPDGFARSHLKMARSAFAAIGVADLLQVHCTHDITVSAS